MKENEKYFNVLRKIGNNTEMTQRELAKELGYSLGKLNYCLKALQNKGFIKIKHFKRNLRRNPNKFNYLYTLTTNEKKNERIRSIKKRT